MKSALIVFESNGNPVSFLASEANYRRFVSINPKVSHRLLCPDPNCNGKVYMHEGARNRRVGANHVYTEKGFTHHAGEASDECKYNFKNDLRFSKLSKNKHLEEIRDKVRKTLLDPYTQDDILAVLREMLGPQADCKAEFKKLLFCLAQEEVLNSHPRFAPAMYISREKDELFNMAYKSGRRQDALYVTQSTQEVYFESVRGHTRKAILPKTLQLMRFPSLTNVDYYRFCFDFDGNGKTRIRQDRTVVPFGTEPPKKRNIVVLRSVYEKRATIPDLGLREVPPAPLTVASVKPPSALAAHTVTREQRTKEDRGQAAIPPAPEAVLEFTLTPLVVPPLSKPNAPPRATVKRTTKAARAGRYVKDLPFN